MTFLVSLSKLFFWFSMIVKLNIKSYCNWSRASALTIQDLFVRYSQVSFGQLRPSVKEEGRRCRLSGFSSAQGHYRQIKRRGSIYRSIFLLLGMLFLALVPLVMYMRIYIALIFIPSLLVKAVVILACVLLALPAFYLAAQNPFDEQLWVLERRALRRLREYWSLSQSSSHQVCVDGDLGRLDLFLCLHWRQEVEDAIGRLIQQMRHERGRIMYLKIAKKEREVMLAELLVACEQQLDAMVVQFKNRLMQTVPQIDGTANCR